MHVSIIKKSQLASINLCCHLLFSGACLTGFLFYTVYVLLTHAKPLSNNSFYNSGILEYITWTRHIMADMRRVFYSSPTFMEYFDLSLCSQPHMTSEHCFFIYTIYILSILIVPPLLYEYSYTRMSYFNLWEVKGWDPNESINVTFGSCIKVKLIIVFTNLTFETRLFKLDGNTAWLSMF